MGATRWTPCGSAELILSDVKRFAALAGVQNLFPSLSTDFLREILSNKEQTSSWSKARTMRIWAIRNACFSR